MRNVIAYIIVEESREMHIREGCAYLNRNQQWVCRNRRLLVTADKQLDIGHLLLLFPANLQLFLLQQPVHGLLHQQGNIVLNSAADVLVQAF